MSVDATQIVALLADRGETIACAESLTGGLITSTLVDIPGSSTVVRGGVVAYATELKHSMLDVPAELLNERGAVDPDVACAMARGVLVRCGSTYGLSCTGVAGPAAQDGKAPGEVHLALAILGRPDAVVESHQFSGDRNQVRTATVLAALELLQRGILSRGATDVLQPPAG